MKTLFGNSKVAECEQAKGLDLGADAYLTKPFSSVVFHAAVNRLMTTQKELKDYYYSPESAYKQSGDQLIHQEDKEFIDSVTAIIKDNITQDTLRPELIADKLGMNTRALYRRLKKNLTAYPQRFHQGFPPDVCGSAFAYNHPECAGNHLPGWRLQ